VRFGYRMYGQTMRGARKRTTRHASVPSLPSSSVALRTGVAITIRYDRGNDSTNGGADAYIYASRNNIGYNGKDCCKMRTVRAGEIRHGRWRCWRHGESWRTIRDSCPAARRVATYALRHRYGAWRGVAQAVPVQTAHQGRPKENMVVEAGGCALVCRPALMFLMAMSLLRRGVM